MRRPLHIQALEARELFTVSVVSPTGALVPQQLIDQFIVDAVSSLQDDAHEDRLAGDVDENGSVDVSDFRTLAANYGNDQAIWQDGDLNGDGSVSMSDFLILSGNYGATRPTAPAAQNTDLASHSQSAAEIYRRIVGQLLANQLSQLTSLSVQLKRLAAPAPGTSQTRLASATDLAFAEAADFVEDVGQAADNVASSEVAGAAFRDAVLTCLENGELEEQHLYEKLVDDHGLTISTDQFREQVRTLTQHRTVQLKVVDYFGLGVNEQRYSLRHAASN